VLALQFCGIALVPMMTTASQRQQSASGSKKRIYVANASALKINKIIKPWPKQVRNSSSLQCDLIVTISPAYLLDRINGIGYSCLFALLLFFLAGAAAVTSGVGDAATPPLPRPRTCGNTHLDSRGERKGVSIGESRRECELKNRGKRQETTIIPATEQLLQGCQR
jgi:hypothetical protein